jgi:integrase
MRNIPVSSAFSENLPAANPLANPSRLRADDWAVAYWLTACASKSAETMRAYRMQANRYRAFLAALTDDPDNERLLLDSTYEQAGKFVNWLEGTGGDIPQPIAARFGMTVRQAKRPKVSPVVMRQAVITLHGLYQELTGAMLPSEQGMAVKVNPFAPYRRKYTKTEARAAALNHPDAPGVGKALSRQAWGAVLEHARAQAESVPAKMAAKRSWILLRMFCAMWERRSAMASLTWADLQRTRDGVWSMRRDRKGKGAVWAAIPENAVADLLRWRRDVGLPAEATADELAKSVFWLGGRSAGHDGPLNDKTVYRIIKQLFEATAVQVESEQPSIARELRRAGAGPHTLRHTMATMFVESGGDLRDAQKSLGHSSLDTTSIYDNYSNSRHASVMGDAYGKAITH